MMAILLFLYLLGPNHILTRCNPHDLIGIKGKIDADENGLIIKAIKITFLSSKSK